MKASSAQVKKIGELLYYAGCGFSTAAKYAKQAESFTTRQADIIIKYVTKHGLIKNSIDDEMLNDILKRTEDKCLICKVERKACTC